TGGGTLPVPDFPSLVNAPTSSSSALLSAQADSVTAGSTVEATNEATGDGATTTATGDGAFVLELPGAATGSTITLSGETSAGRFSGSLELPPIASDLSVTDVVASQFDNGTGVRAVVAGPPGTFARVANISTGQIAEDGTPTEAGVRVLIPAAAGDRLVVVAFDSNDRSRVSEAVVVVF
ncbi:MAG: hypothetical protein AAF658_01215, partial [Myxococcota bacterium]